MKYQVVRFFKKISLISLCICISACTMSGNIASLDSSSSGTGLPENNTTILPNPNSILISNLAATGASLSWQITGNSVNKFLISVAQGTTVPTSCTTSDTVATGLNADLSGLLPDTVYSVRICSVDPTNPSSFSSGTTGSFHTLTLVVRSAAIPGFTNWNDYVKNDGAKFYQPSGTACPGNGLNYSECINGGIVQKVSLGNIACNRISTSDRLGVFQWGCDSSGSTTVIFSTGVNSFKGLSNLISGHSFINNYIIISVDKVPTYSTAPEVWWTNTIQEIPDSPNGTSTSLVNNGNPSGKIFTVSSVKTNGAYSIDEDKISVVVMPGSELIKDTGSTAPLLKVSAGVKYLWIEGKFNGNNVVTSVLSLGLITQSRIHNVESRNATAVTGSLITVAGANKVLVSDFYVHHGAIGVETNTGSAITLNNGKLSNISNYGVDALSTGFATNLTFAHNSGEQIAYPYYSSFNNITFVNNTGNYGARLASTSYDLFHNILSSNSGYRSFYAWHAANHVFSQILSVGSGGEEIGVLNSQGDHKFTNNIILESSAECYIVNDTGFSPGLGVGTCLASGPLSNSILTTGAMDQTKIFGGKVLTNDAVSPYDVSGLSLLTDILDWAKTESFFRLWGNDGGTFPISTNQGPCTSGSCRIWDYRLQATASNPAWNRTLSPAALNSNFASGMTCPDSVNGMAVTTYYDGSTTKTFLTNAYEIIGDGIGNDNGLCESGEACIYTPNFGAYQGEGDYLSQGTCNFTNGTVTGVKMYAYPTNGI